jgi:hypothetical protein
MYIKQVRINNIRSLGKVDWEIRDEQVAGWHVILGDNGAGKSSFVRSVALVLVGLPEAQALLEEWYDWIRRDEDEALIRLYVIRDENYDQFSDNNGMTRSNLSIALRLKKQPSDDKAELINATVGMNPQKYIWGEGGGWFSAGYGPLRRFFGSDQDYARVLYTKPKLARHLSVFDESVALTESLEWLKFLQYRKLENQPSGNFLDSVKAFINQEGFLPFGARLERVSSDGVEFVDGNGCQVWIEDLSDGYRSVLSMTLELIRQLEKVYGADRVFDPNDPGRVVAPGVVLIDEVDAHLHPTWQRRIGLWFRQHFPNMQFIVTTHSPLVCQAADQGTVWRLSDPGSSEPGHMITGVELDRLLYGNILEAYSTEAFGNGITRSAKSRELLGQLAELNQKELHGQLTEQEKQEQARLRAMLPTSAHVENKEAAV